MSIKVYGIETLMASIEQGGARAANGVIDEMRKIGLEIRDKARENAPVDKGDLEKAIKMRDAGGGRSGSSGRFLRKSIEIYIDQEMSSSDGSGKTVGDYAYEMHEYLTPYGSLNLGPKSVSKQAFTGGLVGGGFLERAIDEISETLMERLVKRSIREL